MDASRLSPINRTKMVPFSYHPLSTALPNFVSLRERRGNKKEGKTSSKVFLVLGLLAATVLLASDVAATDSVETIAASTYGVHPFKLLAIERYCPQS